MRLRCMHNSGAGDVGSTQSSDAIETQMHAKFGNARGRMRPRLGQARISDALEVRACAAFGCARFRRTVICEDPLSRSAKRDSVSPAVI